MKQFIATILYGLGKKPMTSTFIDEEHITMGYGKLHSIGTWEYPLPQHIIKKTFGAVKWNDIK